MRPHRDNIDESGAGGGGRGGVDGWRCGAPGLSSTTVGCAVSSEENGKRGMDESDYSKKTNF